MACVGAGYWYQIQYQKLLFREQALEQGRKDLAARQAEIEQKIAQVVELRVMVANDAVAVAGEFRLLGLRENRDVTAGEATLRRAKEEFDGGRFADAYTLARQATEELKAAPVKIRPQLPRSSARRKTRYTVRPADTLWSIAQKSHLRSGFKWRKIWQANRGQVSDPDVIHPRQVLVIPSNGAR